MKQGDVAILTADHGCDPTWRGADHTREQVPVLMFGPSVRPASHGLRRSFADIGETVAQILGVEAGPHGTGFWPAAGSNA